MFDRHLEAEDQEPAQTSARASAAERVGTASDAEGHPGIGAHLPPGASGELAAPLMAHWVQDGIGTAGTAGEGAGNGAATESQATAGGGGPWAAAPPPGTNDSGPGTWSPGGGSLPSERGGARNLGGGWDFDSAFASQAGMRQTVGARDHVGARALTGAVTAGLPGGASGLSGTMGAAGGLQGTGATDALRAVAAKGGGTASRAPAASGIGSSRVPAVPGTP